MPSPYHYILAHGLNVQPSVMQSLAEELGWGEGDFSVISLPGHSGDEELSREAADRWLASFRQQYNQVYQNQPNVIFTGYSLGGLLMTYLLGTGQIEPPYKQILLAPALAFQQWTKVPTILPKAAFDKVMIPSFTPLNYKANAGVSLGAYRVLFAISSELNGFDASLYNVPTLVICDRWDELVQAAGLRKFIEVKQLSNWRLFVVSSGFWNKMGKKHLLVAREFQTEAHWQQVRQEIEKFLHE